MKERLDHALVTTACIRLFLRAKVLSLEASTSDYLPIFLDLALLVVQSRIKRFCFENVWLREPNCVNVVKESWISSVEMPLQFKITNYGSDLFQWGNHLSRDFRNRILACKRRMGSLWGKSDEVSMAQFTEARSMYNELLHNHEVYWKQRSKLIWLKEGDMNSKYFHATASTWKRWNTVGKLRNSQGHWCTRPEEINDLIAEYFTDIYSSKGDSRPEVLLCVTSKISTDQNHQLMELLLLWMSEKPFSVCILINHHAPTV